MGRLQTARPTTAPTLDLRVCNNFVNWGSYKRAHTYATSLSATVARYFGIFDAM